MYLNPVLFWMWVWDGGGGGGHGGWPCAEARRLADGVVQHNSTRKLLDTVTAMKLKPMSKKESSVAHCALS